MTPRIFPAASRANGFSLIELLVSMVIGLVVTLAITSVLIRSEGSKRSTTSVNDVEQSGSYAAYVLGRSMRNAGTGFSQAWGTTYGCLLNASQSGSQVLPASIPASSAFSNFKSPAIPGLRLTPMLAGKGLASGTGGDLLMVLGGMAGGAEVPLAVTPGSVTATSPAQLQVTNTLGYQTGNIVLLADSAVAGGCLLAQVGSPSPAASGSPAGVVPLSGTYFTAAGSTVQLSDFGASTRMAPLGLDASNPPQFRLFGVGPNNTLMSYDLLQPAASAEQSIADGVVEMRALYGLDTGSPPNGRIDSWVDPSGTYAASALMDGTPSSQALLRQIVAVRLGMILRTSLPERPQDRFGQSLTPAQVAALSTTQTLFADAVDASGASLAETRTIAGSDNLYRYRTIDVVIPLPNVLYAPPLP